MVSRFASLAVFGVLVLIAHGADAGPISPNNPYRSFNISGINYGAEEWEREHRAERPVQPQASRPLFSPRPRRGLLFRR